MRKSNFRDLRAQFIFVNLPRQCDKMKRMGDIPSSCESDTQFGDHPGREVSICDMSVFSRIMLNWNEHPRRRLERWYVASSRYLRAQWRPPLRQIAPGFAAACGGII